MIECIDKGILYRNPLPQLRVANAYFPTHVQLSQHEHLCIYKCATAFESADGRLAQLRSTDGGRTWNEEGLIWDGSQDDRPYSYQMGDIAKLYDGILIIVSARFDRSDPDKPIWNPQTEGYLPPKTVLFFSKDGGRSWSAPLLVDMPYDLPGNCIQVIEVQPGSLMLTFETWKLYDDPGIAKQRAVASFSDDGGSTWGNPTVVADGIAERINYWDTRVIPLGDGRLLAVFWTHDCAKKKDLPIHRSVSEDAGKTWSRPETTQIEGQVSSPVSLGDSRVLLAYNLRHGSRPGIYAVISENEGKTWDLSQQTVVWDPKGQTNVGTKSADTALAEMATFAFGYPWAQQVAADEVLVTFWCTASCVTHIQWRRLYITEERAK